MTKEQINTEVCKIFATNFRRDRELAYIPNDVFTYLMALAYEAGFKEGYKRNGYIDVEPATVETE